MTLFWAYGSTHVFRAQRPGGRVVEIRGGCGITRLFYTTQVWREDTRYPTCLRCAVLP